MKKPQLSGVGRRVFIVWLTFTFALLVAGLLGTWVEASLGAPVFLGQLVRAAVVSGIVLPFILRRRALEADADRILGLTPLDRSLSAFVFGVAVVVLLVGLALAVGVFIGELRVIGVQLSLTLVFALLWEAFIAFFYEALPEELTFRGYLQGRLNTRLARWLALLVQVALFVSAALTVALSRQLLGLGAGISSLSGVTLDYIILLLTFGIALTLCRLITGSVWASIAFHLTFLTLNPDVLGPDAFSLIQVAETVPQTREVLLFFLGPLAGGSLLLFILPYLKRQPLGWRERLPSKG